MVDRVDPPPCGGQGVGLPAQPAAQVDRCPAIPGTGQFDDVSAQRELGVFARHLVLDAAVDVERVSACHETGVLTIRMPLATPPARRRITVTTTAATAPVPNAPVSNAPVSNAAPTGGRSEDGAA